MSLKKHPIKIGCVSAVLVPTVVVVLWCLLGYLMPNNSLEALLQGNTVEEIASVTLFDHNRTITLNDPESMRYLTTAFRNSTDDGYTSKHGLGESWNIGVKLKHQLGTAYTGIYVPEEANGFTVMRDFDIGSDPKFHWVSFPEPLPEPLSAVLDQLRKR